MLAAARHKSGIAKRGNRCGLPSSGDIERRTHAVERRDQARLTIAPANAFGRKAIDFGKCARNQDIVMLARKLQRGRAVILKILAIGLVQNKDAVAG